MINIRNQQGVALLEVAISVFILGVGLLGLASLQFMSLKNMQLSSTSNLANTHLQQIAEAMRNYPDNLSVFEGGREIKALHENMCLSACLEEQSAQAHLHRIENEIFTDFSDSTLTITSESLASYTTQETEEDADGNAQVNTKTTNINVYSITLEWKEQGDFILKNSDVADKSQTLKVVL